MQWYCRAEKRTRHNNFGYLLGLNTKEVELNISDKKHVTRHTSDVDCLPTAFNTSHQVSIQTVSLHQVPLTQTVSKTLITLTVSLQHALPTPITQTVTQTPTIPPVSLAIPNPITHESHYSSSTFTYSQHDPATDDVYKRGVAHLLCYAYLFIVCISLQHHFNGKSFVSF